MPTGLRSTALKKAKVSVLSKRFSVRKGFQIVGDESAVYGMGEKLIGWGEANDEAINSSIVADALEDASPFHQEFDWDDASAAYKQRLRHAGYLRQAIQMHVIYSNDPGHEVLLSPAVVVYPTPDIIDETTPEAAWRPQVTRAAFTQEDVMNNEKYRNFHLQRALVDMANFEKKYSYLEELSEVFAVIAKATAKHGKKKR